MPNYMTVSTFTKQYCTATFNFKRNRFFAYFMFFFTLELGTLLYQKDDDKQKKDEQIGMNVTNVTSCYYWKINIIRE